MEELVMRLLLDAAIALLEVLLVQALREAWSAGTQRLRDIRLPAFLDAFAA